MHAVMTCLLKPLLLLLCCCWVQPGTALAARQTKLQGIRDAAMAAETRDLEARLTAEEADVKALKLQLERAKDAQADCDQVITTIVEPLFCGNVTEQQCEDHVSVARTDLEDKLAKSAVESAATEADLKKQIEKLQLELLKATAVIPVDPKLECTKLVKSSGLVTAEPNELSIIRGNTQYIVANKNENTPMVTWAEARDVCKSKGMLMLRLEDTQEKLFLKPYLPKLGLKAALMYIFWLGSPRLPAETRYTSWVQRLWECEVVPNYDSSELCASVSFFQKPQGLTHQSKCDEKKHYFCEKSIN